MATQASMPGMVTPQITSGKPKVPEGDTRPDVQNGHTPIVEHPHWNQPVAVGDWTIYVSANLDMPTKTFWWEPGTVPDLMFALSVTSWKSDCSEVYTVGVQEDYPYRNVPTVLVDWPDRGDIPLDTTRWLMGLAIKRLKKGQKVDVGCMAGHGRTGTFLACLIGQVEELSPKKAIKTVRKRYCKKAVECEKQTIMVYKYLGGTEKKAKKDWKKFFDPSPPVYNYSTTYTYNSATGCYTSTKTTSSKKETDDWQPLGYTTKGYEIIYEEKIDGHMYQLVYDPAIDDYLDLLDDVIMTWDEYTEWMKKL
jgi:hypothetical protein